MTGGLRTSATDIMEAHADVLPFNLQVDQLCHRSAVRLTTLLNCHSLAPHVRKAARRFVKRHRCPLHELMDAFKQHLYSKNTERIRSTRLHPRWHPQHHVKMLDDRKAAIEASQSILTAVYPPCQTTGDTMGYGRHSHGLLLRR